MSSLNMFYLFSKLVIPSLTSNLLRSVSTILNTIFSGHMGDEKLLAAVGLSNTFYTMFLTAMIIGLNAAQETLTT